MRGRDYQLHKPTTKPLQTKGRYWALRILGIGGCSEYMAKPPPENQSHSFSSFWWEVFKNAWKTAEEKIGRAITWLAIISPVILYFVFPSSNSGNPHDEAKWEDAVNHWEAFIIFGLWLAWFIYHVAKAPHEIYLKQWEKHQKEIGEKEELVGRLKAANDALTEKTMPLKIEDIICESRTGLQHSCWVKIRNQSKATPANNLKIELISIDPIPKMAELPTHNLLIVFPIKLQNKSDDTRMVNPQDYVLYGLFTVKQAAFEIEVEFLTGERWRKFTANYTMTLLGDQSRIENPKDEYILTLSASDETRSPVFRKFKMAFSERSEMPVLFSAVD